MTTRRCLHCGALVLSRRRCSCRKRAVLGYGSAWQRESRALRTAASRCADCGATVDLTVDHPTRDVVCRRCNSKRGATTHG